MLDTRFSMLDAGTYILQGMGFRVFGLWERLSSRDHYCNGWEKSRLESRSHKSKNFQFE